jgi:acetyl-CoA carboxylase carboxyl transferase subunit beta
MKLPEIIKRLFVSKPKTDRKEITLPDNLFVQCPQCKITLYRKKLNTNADVCPDCSHHFVLSVNQWIDLLADKKSWKPLFADIKPVDSLKFPDYESRLKKLIKEEPEEAISTASCKIDGISILIGIMNPNFLMGSLGSVAGEKIARLFEQGVRDRKPVFLIVRSGGARMQEGVFSLMQMAKDFCSDSSVLRCGSFICHSPYPPHHGWSVC